jgi:hypothetical protein
MALTDSLLRIMWLIVLELTERDYSSACLELWMKERREGFETRSIWSAFMNLKSAF